MYLRNFTRIKKKIIFLVVCFIILTANITRAGVLRGRVLCNDNTPYASGEIILLQNNKVVKKVVTGNNGEYIIAVRSGVYEFRIKRSRFKVIIYKEENMPKDFYIDCATK